MGVQTPGLYASLILCILRTGIYGYQGARAQVSHRGELDEVQMVETRSMTIRAEKRVVIASINRGPSDPRAMQKEARALAGLGYNVTYVCNAASGPVAVDDRLRVAALKMPASRLWLQTCGPGIVLRAALRFRPDAVHVLDSALIGPALRLGRRRGVKIVVDLPEDSAKQILQKDYLGPMAVRKMVSRAYQLASRRLLPRADLVIAATPSIVLSLPDGCRHIVVRNFPAIADIDAVLPHQVASSGVGTRPLRVVYVGGISAIRGIGELVAATGMMRGRAELHLAGPIDDDTYLAEIKSMPGWQYCHYHGWLDWHGSIALVKACDVGACIMQDAPNQIEALPVKVFEYMACSKASVVSSFPLWRRLFVGAALFADPAKPASTVEQLEQLISSPELVHRLSEHGRLMVEKDYSWEHEAEQLAEGYDSLWAGAVKS